MTGPADPGAVAPEKNDAAPHRWQSVAPAASPADLLRLTPGELERSKSSTAPPLLLDVRPLEERRLARLEGDLWIPLDELPARLGEIPSVGPLVVYCHYGGTAARAARLLRRSGRPDVALLEGGIDEYARLVDPQIPRYGELACGAVVLQQFPNRRTGCLSYLLRGADSAEAVVVDPGHDVAPYVRALRQQGLDLRAIVETHTHADHLSGHRELQERTGAPILVGRRSPAQYPHRALEEGEAVDFGGVELLVLETPGHTFDHVSLRVEGRVFTGDTLLPGSCGRTDLGSGDPGLLWESLTGKLLRLPDETEVFPAHYGALHGLPPPERYSTTIGFERWTNEALALRSEREFRRYMTEGWPPKPDDFDRTVATNLSA